MARYERGQTGKVPIKGRQGFGGSLALVVKRADGTEYEVPTVVRREKFGWLRNWARVVRRVWAAR